MKDSKCLFKEIYVLVFLVWIVLTIIYVQTSKKVIGCSSYIIMNLYVSTVAKKLQKKVEECGTLLSIDNDIVVLIFDLANRYALHKEF